MRLPVDDTRRFLRPIRHLTERCSVSTRRRTLPARKAGVGSERRYAPCVRDLEPVATLLETAAPATLTTYRADGSAITTPVWFRFEAGAFEIVIAEGDPKLDNLRRDARCSLLVFETTPPFRGVAVDGVPEIGAGDVTAVRAAIAVRYLGPDVGARFATERTTPGVLLRLAADDARVWDLSAILPRAPATDRP
jgi:hypothetical protein